MSDDNPPPQPPEGGKGKAKQPWQPKNKTAEGAEGGKKKDAAKEDKKAKRAAAVAARGGGGGEDAAASGSGTTEKGKADVAGKAAAGNANAASFSKPKESGKEKATTSNTAAASSTQAGPSGISSSTPTLNLFSHLPKSHIPTTSHPSFSSSKLPSNSPHPLIHRLGLLLSLPSNSSQAPLRGTNARTTALLLTFRSIISQHSWPPREMHRVLPAYLSPMIAYLEGCRPKGIAGGNVIRWLKGEINRIGTDESVREENEVSLSLSLGFLIWTS